MTEDTAFGRRIAESFTTELQGRYDRGEWDPPGSREDAPSSGSDSVLQWTTTWLKKQSYTEASKDLARVTFWLDRTPAFAKMPVRDVTPKAVASWLTELASAPNKQGALPAPRTVRNVADPVHRAIRSAVFEGFIPGGDPFATIPRDVRPRATDAKPERRPQYRLSREEVRLLLNTPIIEPRWRTLWHLLVLTGARLSEAIGLRWSDIRDDTPLRRIVIAGQLHHRTRKRTPTKTRDAREIPEHPLLRSVLDAWKDTGWVQTYGRVPAANDLLVPCQGKPDATDGVGGPLWQQDVYRALQRDLASCGIGRHRVHDLRHTLASLCADAGMAEHVASRWTHTPTTTAGARSMYVRPAWDAQCREMVKLEL